MSNQFPQYQRDVDRTLDEMEDNISQLQNNVAAMQKVGGLQSLISSQVFPEICGSVNTFNTLIQVTFPINPGQVPLVTGAVDMQRVNASSIGYIQIYNLGEDGSLMDNAFSSSNYIGVINTHNHTNSTTIYQMSGSKTAAVKLDSGLGVAFLSISTDDSGPVGQDCTLTVNSASLKVRMI